MGWPNYYFLLEKYKGNWERVQLRELLFAHEFNYPHCKEMRELAEQKYQESQPCQQRLPLPNF